MRRDCSISPVPPGFRSSLISEVSVSVSETEQRSRAETPKNSKVSLSLGRGSVVSCCSGAIYTFSVSSSMVFPTSSSFSRCRSLFTTCWFGLVVCTSAFATCCSSALFCSSLILVFSLGHFCSFTSEDLCKINDVSESRSAESVISLVTRFAFDSFEIQFFNSVMIKESIPRLLTGQSSAISLASMATREAIRCLIAARQAS